MYRSTCSFERVKLTRPPSPWLKDLNIIGLQQRTNDARYKAPLFMRIRKFQEVVIVTISEFAYIDFFGSL